MRLERLIERLQAFVDSSHQNPRDTTYLNRREAALLLKALMDTSARVSG